MSAMPHLGRLGRPGQGWIDLALAVSTPIEQCFRHCSIRWTGAKTSAPRSPRRAYDRNWTRIPV